jgi:hypothetical protein
LPYQLQAPPFATDDGVLERLDELGATLERILLATLLAVLLVAPPKLVASLDVALIPLVLLIK